MKQGARAVVLGLGLLGFSSCVSELPKPIQSQRCNPTCEQINFEQDPRILRGAWTGAVEVAQPSREISPRVYVSMTLTATYLDDAHYSIAGTATLEDKTYAVVGSARVYDNQNLIRGQLSQPPAVRLTLMQGETALYDAEFYYPFQAVKTYQGWWRHRPSGDALPFTLERIAIPPPA